MKIPQLSIELKGSSYTFKAGDTIEGNVHVNINDPRGTILKFSVLTLGLIGCEKTKWEVPDENSVKSQGGEEFLEYGGKKEFINISRVLHNF